MLKKIFKTILIILLLLLFVLFFFAVIKPAYISYKQNKPQVVVDKSGERATSKNKENDDKNKKEIESEEVEYNPFTFDDRILLYEGNINSEEMTKLMNVLIEDIDSQMYSKVDINLNGIDISYNDKENYRLSLNNFKNSIPKDGNYLVEFEYSSLNAVVDKVIIKSI